MQDYFESCVRDAMRAYIVANDAFCHNKQSWLSSPVATNTPEGLEYERVCNAFYEAESKLWMATECEYDEDSFRAACWNWRYWKVMARKCCWYQKFPGGVDKAAETMFFMAEAERRLVELCGWTDIYRSSCSYLEEQFPNLKKEKS